MIEGQDCPLHGIPRVVLAEVATGVGEDIVGPPNSQAGCTTKLQDNEATRGISVQLIWMAYFFLRDDAVKAQEAVDWK